MSVVLAISMLACIAVACGLVLAIRKMACPRVALPATLDWIDELSIERYRPMLGLLSEDEVRSLKQEPGFTPKMEAQFRRQRCIVFRGYLNALSSDFSRVSLALRLLIAQASTDRPDLAATLVRSRLAFSFAILVAHVHVVFYYFGIGSVNAADLLRLFDGMRLELRSLVPCDATAAV